MHCPFHKNDEDDLRCTAPMPLFRGAPEKGLPLHEAAASESVLFSSP